MNLRRFVSGFRLGAVAAALSFLLTAAPQATRLASRIDSSQLFVVKGNTREAVSRGLALDQGEVEDPSTLLRLALHFSLTPTQQADLDALLTAQQDPASKQYHQFLTPEQFADRFGLNPADIQKITGWLTNQGFANLTVARSRTWVSFAATVKQTESDFHTSVHNYLLRGERQFANATDPQLPKALEGLVQSVRGLSDIRPRSQAKTIPQFTSSISGNHYLAPDDWETIYDVQPLYSQGLDGTGVTIVIVGQSDVQPSDLAAFRSAANLVPKAPTVVVPPGDADPGIVSGDETESDLDLEWAGAIARNANILFVTASTVGGNGVDDAIAYAIDNNVAPIMSTSYGRCEAFIGSLEIHAQNSLFQQANAQGMTIVAAGGDAGAADCDRESTPATYGLAVEFPASSPNVTGVGGTSFNEGAAVADYWSTTNDAYNGSALSYIIETVWNDGNGSSGGGGASAYSLKPSWQTGPGVPADGARDVPDIAFDADPDHDGILICGHSWCTNGFRDSTSYLDVIGGTSAGAPSFAGLLALLVQKNGRLGNINPRLYAIAASPQLVFHDIIGGGNVVSCEVGTLNCTTGQIGYPATIGYDLASGWGSLDANNFVQAWSSPLAQSVAISVDGTETVGYSVILTGFTSSGLPVTFTSSTPTVCTVVGSTAFLIAAGTCTIVGSQPGTGAYLAANGSTTFPVVSPITSSAALTFVPVTPCRIADTRLANGPLGGPEIPSNASRDFFIPSSSCNIPANASAYALNVTVVPDTFLGYLTIWPTGQPQPYVSTLNSDGRVKANAAIIGAGTNGGVSVFVSNSSQVILDINGYFVASAGSSPSKFYSLTPCRIADTRSATGPLGGPNLSAGVARAFPVPSSPCGVPANAQAYSLNFTAVPRGFLGFLATWPNGQIRPLVSTLNSFTGSVTANAAIVPAGPDGAINVYASNDADVVIDINGYFAASGASGGLSFYTVAPCRAYDTRNFASGAFNGQDGFVIANSPCLPPASAQAYLLNATVVPPGPLWYLTLWQANAPQPLVSTLNAPDGAVTSNMAIVPAFNGAINTFGTNPTQLILDYSGYFAP